MYEGSAKSSGEVYALFNDPTNGACAIRKFTDFDENSIRLHLEAQKESKKSAKARAEEEKKWKDEVTEKVSLG